jgi:hypothetical protein
MTDQLAIVRLPDVAVAPAYRQSLELMSHFAVEDFGDGIVGVAPAEGPGAVAAHFSLVKVCDATSDLDDEALWVPFEDYPPHQRSDVNPVEYRERMLALGQEILSRNDNAAAQIVAFGLAAFGAGQNAELPHLLRAQLPHLFTEFPDGSLWLVGASQALMARLAFGRSQLAFQLTPDLPAGEEMERLRALEDVTLTSGSNFAPLIDFALLALSPSVLGFTIPLLPQVLVFCFGKDVDLRQPYPQSLASLYRPTVLNDPVGVSASSLLAGTQPADGSRLLYWWVDRLNELYSHATDPTRFTNDHGYHDAAAQTAWMITLERLIGDAVALAAEPQATELDRVQIAFDLLDKGEALLGYGRSDTGKGFAALLRRSTVVPRIREALSSLPDDLAARLADEAERLFNELYSEVRSNTLDYRLTPGGAKVATTRADQIEAVSNDALVSTLCRAVRNSSHGLLDILRDGPDRFLLAANTGGIPAELPALAPIIALSLLAEPAALVDGIWRTKLVGNA